MAALHTHTHTRLPVCLSVCLPVCLSACLFACLLVCLLVCLQVRLSGFLSVRLSVCISDFSVCPAGSGVQVDTKEDFGAGVTKLWCKTLSMFVVPWRRTLHSFLFKKFFIWWEQEYLDCLAESLTAVHNGFCAQTPCSPAFALSHAFHFHVDRCRKRLRKIMKQRLDYSALMQMLKHRMVRDTLQKLHGPGPGCPGPHAKPSYQPNAAGWKEACCRALLAATCDELPRNMRREYDESLEMMARHIHHLTIQVWCPGALPCQVIAVPGRAGQPAEGRTGDCPGPREETATRRTTCPRKHSEAGGGRPECGGECAAKTEKRPPQQPTQPPVRQVLGCGNAKPTPAGTQPAASDRTRCSTRREELVTVQGSVKKQPPDL